MRFNKLIIQNIFEKTFWDDVVDKITRDIISLDEEDCFLLFNEEIDCAELDSIDSLKILNYQLEQIESSVTEISGLFNVIVDINGFRYENGEKLYISNVMMHMLYGFSFRNTEENFDSLYLEYID